MRGMGRLPRIHYPGAVYHAMARGVDGREIFHDDEDRKFFLRVLYSVGRDSRSRLLAYCLMGNHFHIAIRIDAVPLSTVMQRILTSYSLSFNQKHVRTGHLFQARYKAVLCTGTAQLIALIRYIHMNPVRAALATQPSFWPWSSYAAYSQRGKDGMIDSEFDLPDIDVPPPPDFDPWSVSKNDDTTHLLRELPPRISSLDDLANNCLNGTDISVSCLRSRTRRRKVTRIKRSLIRRGLQQGHSLTKMARWLGIGLSSAQHYLAEQ